MALALSHAAQLKPEIRLAQAISEFQATLDDAQKSKFRGYRLQATPEPLEVFRLTKEINKHKNQAGYGSNLGPRLTNVLQSVQQFSSVVDIIVGGSQNLIASGIWAVVKLSLQIAIGVTSFFEKLTELFMEIGRDSPRYQQLGSLFPLSENLQKYLCEYFVIICQVCQEAVKISKRWSLVQATISGFRTFENPFGKLRDSLSLKAKIIYDEVWMLSQEAEKNERAENSKFRALSAKPLNFTAIEIEHARAWRRDTAIWRLLDACSTYDFQSAWKRILKKGASPSMLDRTEYKQWKSRSTSSNFWCKGRLGAGKSVLAANVTEDLIPTGPDTTWSYFFCLHDDVDSLRARTIIGSLARQVFSQCRENLPEDSIKYSNPTFDIEEILRLLLKVVAGCQKQHFIVLDGLDECASSDIESCVKFISQLTESQAIFKIFWTSRPDMTEIAARQLQANGESLSLLQIREERSAEISQYVETELSKRLDTGHLCIGTDQRLVRQIQDRLVGGADGMFLWVALQLDLLCQEPTDKRILAALDSLPRDLTDTFDRILQRVIDSTLDCASDIMVIFKVVTVAQRPLSLEELREAIGVEIGEVVWDPQRLVNDMGRIIGRCGSLLVVDEEDSTVRFTHHSAKKHLLSEQALKSHFGRIDAMEADLLLGRICVTYLRSTRFDKELVKAKPPILDKTVDYPSHIIKRTGGAQAVGQLALKLIKNKKLPHADPYREINTGAENDLHSTAIESQYFLQYARDFWLIHTKFISTADEAYHLWIDILLGKGAVVEFPWSPVSLDPFHSLRLRNSATSFGLKVFKWISQNKHSSLAGVLVRSTIMNPGKIFVDPLDFESKFFQVPVVAFDDVAVQFFLDLLREYKLIELLRNLELEATLDAGIFLDDGAVVEEAVAAGAQGCLKILQTGLLPKLTIWDPICFAIQKERLELAKFLLRHDKIHISCRRVTEILVSKLDAGKIEFVTELLKSSTKISVPEVFHPMCLKYWASNRDFLTMIRILRHLEWNVNSLDAAGRSALYIACRAKDCRLDGIRQLLLLGADPNVAGCGDNCPVLAASELGRPAIVALLLEYGADHEHELELYLHALLL